jgi:cell division protein FtsB
MARRWLRSLLFFAGCVGLIAYFSYHAVHGGHGLERRAALEGRIRSLEAELAALRAERKLFERDVSLVTEKAAREPDLLDEQARALLNFAKPTDIILVRDRAGEK